MLIDSHCHIHDTETYEFALSRVQGKHQPSASDYTPEKLLARAHENGIKKLICIGTTHEDSLKARDFAAQHEDVYWAYGIHPDEAGTIDEAKDSSFQRDLERTRFEEKFHKAGSPAYWGALPEILMKIGREAKQSAESCYPLPIAIGEIGLDYRNGTSTKESQIRLLEQMLQLATDNHLPCIFHVREAFDDFFAVIRNFPDVKRAVVHSFSDSPENLQKSLDAGFFIGVNGLATFANIPLPPLSCTLLETDSPFLAPVPHRGEVDEPAFVKNVANFLAIHYQTTFEDVAKITTENAERLFNI